MSAVYEAIAAVSAEMAATGIAKSSRNAAQGFNFRGIDAVYNALAPMLAKHKLCILPRILSRECAERVNGKGTALFYVTVHAEFDLVSAVDGTKHTVATYGEAMDSGDKATNKAMSAAYKYAAFQTFCIPTEETALDADANTHADITPAFSMTTAQIEMESADTMDQLRKAFANHYKAAPESAKDEVKARYDTLKANLSAITEGATNGLTQ